MVFLDDKWAVSLDMYTEYIHDGTTLLLETDWHVLVSVGYNAKRPHNLNILICISVPLKKYI